VVGEALTVVVRPEVIQLGGRADAGITWTGVVRQRFFRGARNVYTIECGLSVSARTPRPTNRWCRAPRCRSVLTPPTRGRSARNPAEPPRSPANATGSSLGAVGRLSPGEHECQRWRFPAWLIADHPPDDKCRETTELPWIRAAVALPLLKPGDRLTSNLRGPHTMRPDTLRNAKARQSRDDRPRRTALGFACLLLTLSAGYLVAQRGVVDPAAALTDEAEIVDDSGPQQPTLAEIMAQIDEVAARHHVPPRLVAAVISVESEFNPRAVSRRGAQGLMQLMPETAATLDVQDTFDPRENIEGGVRHLRVLMDRYHNDLPLVLAAYNAGDRAVINYRGVPPYRETRQYVIRVLRRFDRDAARAAAQRIYGTPPRGKANTPRPRSQVTVIQLYSVPTYEPAPVVETAPPPPVMAGAQGP
jgi:soluble lytic murein transglycosylase-like protein